MLDQCSKQAGVCDIDFKNLKDRFTGNNAYDIMSKLFPIKTKSPHSIKIVRV